MLKKRFHNFNMLICIEKKKKMTAGDICFLFFKVVTKIQFWESVQNRTVALKC